MALTWSASSRVYVDTAARSALAEHLRQLIDGRITNDQFQHELPSSRDPAVSEVGQLSWYLYDDAREYWLTGNDRLPPETRAEVERWIAFLHTDLPYEWPTRAAWLGILCFLVLYPMNLLTLGAAGRLWYGWHKRRMDRLGDFECWPFLRESDCRSAAQAAQAAQAVVPLEARLR